MHDMHYSCKNQSQVVELCYIFSPLYCVHDKLMTRMTKGLSHPNLMTRRLVSLFTMDQDQLTKPTLHTKSTYTAMRSVNKQGRTLLARLHNPLIVLLIEKCLVCCTEATVVSLLFGRVQRDGC